MSERSFSKKRGPRATERSHTWIDERSLALARRNAEKLRADPQLLEVARSNLLRWKERLQPWPLAYQEWERILERPLDEILEALTADTEVGRRRRQSSPFVGILTQKERREIFKHYETL